MMTGLRGSAVATVRMPLSTLTGQTVYCRRYLGERFFTTGSGEGSSPRKRYGSCSCTAKALSTSSRFTAPMAIRASPSISPVVAVRLRASAIVS
jgi:hypothetical protein